MQRLSPSLKPIYELELALGNEVERVDEPAGSRCPLAIVFKKPLHVTDISARLKLSEEVTEWESSDPHYPAEKGFHCARTNHVIGAPKS
jgi:hypothetical protein